MKNGRAPRYQRTFLRQWRQFRGYTLEQLAERAGTTHGTISRLENGRLPYGQQLFEDLAKALGTDAASLIGRDPTDSEGVWAISNKIRNLPPASRRQAIRLLETLSEPDSEER